MKNKFKNEILQSMATVHHDMGNMLGEIKYLSRDEIPKMESTSTIEAILKDYNNKKCYLEYLQDLISD